ncbi:MAG: hypothetical protein OGM16_15615 [Lachnospiraceae bacterium]|nr:MAG: hypothetical protein OGM16_15615 [Lachnospiraceae bacterium]
MRKAKPAGSEKWKKNDSKGENGRIARCTVPKEAMIPVPIIKGNKVGKTVKAQSKSPFLAPSKEVAGESRSRIRKSKARRLNRIRFICPLEKTGFVLIYGVVFLKMTVNV